MTKGLNKIEKKLFKIEHGILVGMFEEAMNGYADALGVSRNLVWKLLFEELNSAKK